MTTYVQFQPTPAGAYTFQATIDGQTYLMRVPWNAFRRDWYLTCTGNNGALVFSQPLIGSPTGNDINLAKPWFQGTVLIFRSDTQQFEITP